MFRRRRGHPYLGQGRRLKWHLRFGHIPYRGGLPKRIRLRIEILGLPWFFPPLDFKKSLPRNDGRPKVNKFLQTSFPCGLLASTYRYSGVASVPGYAKMGRFLMLGASVIYRFIPSLRRGVKPLLTIIDIAEDIVLVFFFLFWFSFLLLWLFVRSNGFSWFFTSISSD